MESKEKLLIAIRHGERSDFLGIEPVFGTLDPELSPKGIEQAFDTGVLLAKTLKEMGYPSESTKINVTASPFLRTIQTGREFIKGINSTHLYSVPKTICIDSRFVEILYQRFFLGNYPINFLHVIKPTQAFEEEVKGFELKQLNSYDLLPTKDEEDEDHHKRVGAFIKEAVKEVSQSEYEVTLLISHGAPVTEIKKALGGPEPFNYYKINLCEMFFYVVKDNEAKYKMKVTPYIQTK